MFDAVRQPNVGADVPVVVIARPGCDLDALVDAALDAGGAWTALESKLGVRGCARPDLRIAIKPDLDAFDRDAATAADPRLVEAVIARLRHEGYQSVVLCDGRNQPDGWLHNRGPLCVPDLIGYHFEAPEGVPYDIRFVDDEHEIVPLHPADTARSLRIATAWLQADFRITIGKNKTDDELGYALCVHNLLGLVPTAAVASTWAPEDRCVHVLRCAPPDFALLDAVVSSQCRIGEPQSRRLQTDTLIASPDAILVDWIAALKMGLDPFVSPVNAAALRCRPLPPSWTLIGDADPWPNWTNTSQVRLESVRATHEWPELHLFAAAALQHVDRECFPLRELLIDHINAMATSRLASISDVRLRQGVITSLYQVMAMAAGAYRAYVSTVHKDGVIRSAAPITADVASLPPEMFEAAVGAVREHQRVLDGAPTDARGFRIRTVDGHIHFSASTTLPFTFDEFVQRVDIARAIQYMNDYVGGHTIAVARDELGRPIHQVERNIYLPQPNWTSLGGGITIDVEKVEVVRYDSDRHSIWWQTMRSANRSADSDDGTVTFLRNDAGDVEVRIFARQRFRRPPAIAAARVERFHGTYAELVSEAYANFFNGTIANLQAAYHGSPFRIGREIDLSTRRSAVGSSLYSMLGSAGALFGEVSGAGNTHRGTNGAPRGRSGGPTVLPLEVDALGFHHFAGEAGARSLVAAIAGDGEPGADDDELTIRTFLVELGQAIARDVRTAAAV